MFITKILKEKKIGFDIYVVAMVEGGQMAVGKYKYCEISNPIFVDSLESGLLELDKIK